MKSKYLNTPLKILVVAGIGLIGATTIYMGGCSGGSSSGSSGSVGAVDPCDVVVEASLTTQDHIGGATSSIALFTSTEGEWTLFNVANELRATLTPDGTTKNIEYAISVPGFIHDIEVVTLENGNRYALLAMGDEGISAVNITNPAAMVLAASEKVNYAQSGITWADGSGAVTPANTIASSRAPISSLAVYNQGSVEAPDLQLIIGDEGYGLHKTALSNLLDGIRDEDGTTLKIDSEVYTLQYAGENPWGGPKSLKLYGEGSSAKLFVAQGFLGMGIFDPNTLQQVGRYSLYTDIAQTEDWFINMDIAAEVQTPAANYLDSCTGMPNYNQVSFEITDVWHGTTVAATPWANFEGYGKYYYDARNIDVATFGGKPIAYIAYGSGGLVAVDVTGYETAQPRVVTDGVCEADPTNFLEATYLGYAPAVPAYGSDEHISDNTTSIFRNLGSGILSDSGVFDVKVDVTTNQIYFTDHFAGLLVLGNADSPAGWRGIDAPYDNDSNGIPGDHVPNYEFVTSYDMTPAVDEEGLPAYVFQSPVLLVTGEVSGHGGALALTSPISPDAVGTDVVMAAGGGGLSFVDVNLIADPKFTVPVHIATTNEIAAVPDGFLPEGLNVGQSQGLTAYKSLLFLADGPHGTSVWKIADGLCLPTDDVRLVANSLQSESAVTIDETTTINATPHAYDVVLDQASSTALVMSQSLGVRRITSAVVGEIDAPILLYPNNKDIFEHNVEGVSIFPDLNFQDNAYSVALKGSLAFTADGGNGLTVYDLSKDPTNPASGYMVGNIGGLSSEKPLLGNATGVALWANTATGKAYAFVAAGSAGVGVVDVTDPKNMQLVKVFQPFTITPEGHASDADGRSVTVKIVGDYAYFTYDSFGVVNYRISDLIEALPADIVDPTVLNNPNEVGARPYSVAHFKLQDLAEFADLVGGALGFDVIQVDGKVLMYVAYGDAGVVKIDWSNPESPILKQHANTVGTAMDVTVTNGRVYVADGGGGLALLK